jgi:hypothetical protein
MRLAIWYHVPHPGFLRTLHWHRADTWNLFVDDAMEVACYRQFRLSKCHHLLIDLFDGIMGAPLTMRRQEGMTDE